MLSGITGRRFSYLPLISSLIRRGKSKGKEPGFICNRLENRSLTLDGTIEKQYSLSLSLSLCLFLSLGSG